MNSILSIATLTIRNAIRSRLVLTLLLILLVMILGLPQTIEGDGTAQGAVQILLTYTLGITGLILSVMTIWAACGSIATEIETRQLYMVITKPLHPLQLWTGKWLGLVALNGILLVFAGAIIALSLAVQTRQWIQHPDQLHLLEEQVLTARTVRYPVDPALEEQVQQEYQQRLQAKKIPPTFSPEAAVRHIRERMQREANTVPPGGQLSWTIPLPHKPFSAPFFVRFRFSSSHGGRSRIRGQWNIAIPDDAALFSTQTIVVPDRDYTLTVPRELPKSARQVTLTYANINEEPVTVIFAPTTGLALLLPHGSFLANYIRVLTMMLIKLGFLAAVGLTAGAALSSPVAVFASAWVVLLVNITDYIQRMSTKLVFFAGHHDVLEKGPEIYDHIFRAVFKVFHVFLQPLQATHTLAALTHGENVPWAAVARQFTQQTVFYCGLLALLSAWILRRRELGLPSK